MTNSDIARSFKELANLMELHQDNPFKIRSYRNAYNRLRKIDQPLAEMDEASLLALDGVGKAIASKIQELSAHGKMETLEKWREKTPAGIREMLEVRGFGPKKIKAVREGLKVESIGQLLYAINENRLVELKGFGAKTQESLRHKLEFHQRSKGNFLFRDLEKPALELVGLLRASYPDFRHELTGALRRKDPVLQKMEILTTLPLSKLAQIENLLINDNSQATSTADYHDFPVLFHQAGDKEFGSAWFRTTGQQDFLRSFADSFPGQSFKHLNSEEEIFNQAGIPAIVPELRHGNWGLELAMDDKLPKLIELHDIRGVVHCHSVWSDGIHTIRQMAEACQKRGYAYLTMTDHSQSAVYANGLQPDRVKAQWDEIDQLNEEMKPFRIYKGIESDILSDGSLDYHDELLEGFDLVIASIHSGLQMDETRATERLIQAISHPATTVLGHPTGRLLLSRQGYPINHVQVIDACAEHGVVIELNANPYRLDLDYSWIPYAIERGVPISINPDAHAMGGIDDIYYGICAARKGGLSAQACWNTQESLPV